MRNVASGGKKRDQWLEPAKHVIAGWKTSEQFQIIRSIYDLPPLCLVIRSPLLVTGAGPAATVAYSIAIIWTHSFSEDNCNVCVLCMKTLFNDWYATARFEDVTHVWQLAVMPAHAVCQPQPRSSLRVSSNDTFCWCLAFFNLGREGGGLRHGELSSPGAALLTQACCRNVQVWRCEVCALSGIFLVIVDTEDTIGLCGELLGLGRQLTILPFNASYYSWDSDSDGTQDLSQVRTQRRWNTFYPRSYYYAFWTAFTTHI